MVKKFKTFGPQLVFVEQTTGSAVVLTNEQKLSLYKKSQKSSISTDILEEVYRRGYSIWNESFGQTVDQFAFDRVNSFIAGGFAADLDKDLMEKRGLWDNIHAKRERIKNGSGEHMRKPGSKGAPTEAALKNSQTEETQIDEVVVQKKMSPQDKQAFTKYLAQHRSKLSALDNNDKAKKSFKDYNNEPGDKPSSLGLRNQISVGYYKEGTEADDMSAANAAAGKKLRGGRDIELPTPDQIQNRNEISKEIMSQAAGLNPITGIPKTAYDTYQDVKQGNYKDAALTAGVGVASALAGPIIKGGKGVIGTVKRVLSNSTEYSDNIIVEKSLARKNNIKLGVDHNKHFKNNETSEKQSHNPNDSDSRFDGTKSAKNVYQKATPGQPVTEDSEYGMARNELATAKRAIDRLNAKMGRKGEGELEAWVQSKITKASDYLDTVADYIESGTVKEATEDEAKAAMLDRAKMLDQLIQQNQQAQNPSTKTSVSQTAERRTFTPHGEVKTVADKDGAKVTALVPNQAVKKVAPAPRMTNALTTVKRVVKESREEVLTERGADSKGYYRSTESGAGLTAKGANHFGIKTAVTTPPSKLKTGSKAANRRKSFCARMGGMEGPMKDEKGRPTRKAMSLRRWHC
jgi:hypothetical protein